MIQTYISVVFGGLNDYKKWFAEGTKEFWEEHWEGPIRQMKENSGVKETCGVKKDLSDH